MHPRDYYADLLKSHGLREDFFPLKESDLEHIRKELRSLGFSDKEVHKRLETAYQVGRDRFQWIVNTILETLLSRLSDEQRHFIKSSCYFAQFPIGDFNAVAVKCAPKAYLILINVGLMVFLDHLTTLIFRFISEMSNAASSRNNIDPDLKNERRSTGRLIMAAIKDFLIYRQAFAPLYDTSSALFPGRATLLQKMEEFILCHEISHVLKGHLDSDKETKISIANFADDKSAEIRAIATDWDQEFEADAGGALLMLDLPGLVKKRGDEFKNDFEPTVNAPLAFLAIGELIEKTCNISSKTHPPCNLRTEKLWNMLTVIFPKPALHFGYSFRQVLRGFVT